MLNLFTSRALALICAGLLGGCGVTSAVRDAFTISPQAGTSPENAQRARRDAAAGKDRGLSDKEIASLTRYRVLGTAGESPIVGYGFLPGQTASYVVYKDGNASHFTTGGRATNMDVIADRLDGTILAGSSKRRIVGTASRGTSMSWNTANLTQQLILRPQRTTFDQVKVYDMEAVRRAPYVAVAAEPNRLELWSLVSGDLFRAGKIANEQPRVIMPDSPVGGLVFGTNDGDVRVWSQGRSSALLYRHGGPILDIVGVKSRGLIVSAGKDGQVLVYSRSEKRMIAKFDFPRAVYDLMLSPDERFLVVRPAQGYPRYIDFEKMTIRRMIQKGNARTKGASFALNGQLFMFLSRTGSVAVWDLYNGRQATVLEVERSRRVIYISTSKAYGYGIFVTEDNRVEIWDLVDESRKYVAYEGVTDIAGLEMSDDGKRVLLPLADGRLVSFDITNGVQPKIRGD